MSDLKDRTIAKLEGEIRALREALAESLEANEQLRLTILPKAKAPTEWGLTRAEERLFIALTQRDFLTLDGCLLVVQQNENSSSYSLVNVRICNLRKKIAAAGAVIKNSFGAGYYLVDRRKWAEVLA